MNDVPVIKDENNELPVPTAWRPALKQLADAIVLGSSSKPLSGFSIEPIEPEIIEISRANIGDYPDAIGALREQTWETSIYIWQNGYWQVLVDLSTEECFGSDLVLHAEVRAQGDGYAIASGLIYVP